MQYANVYVHVRYPPVAQRELDVLGEKLSYSAVKLARDIYGRGYQVDFLIEEGTLRQLVKVYGPLLLGFMNAVVLADQFPSAVADIAHKAGTYSAAIIGEFEQVTKTQPNEVINKRTKSRDVNRLSRIAHNLEGLEYGDLPGAERERLVGAIVEDIVGLYRSDRADPGLQELLNQLSKHKIPQLPHTPREAIEWLERRRTGRPETRALPGPEAQYLPKRETRLLTEGQTPVRPPTRRRARYRQRSQT